MIDLRDIDPAIVEMALAFGKGVRISLTVAADDCVDVGVERGIPAQIVRSVIAAEAMMLAGAVLPVEADVFVERARMALALAKQRSEVEKK